MPGAQQASIQHTFAVLTRWYHVVLLIIAFVRLSAPVKSRITMKKFNENVQKSFPFTVISSDDYLPICFSITPFTYS